VNILFICNQGKNRSKTAAQLFAGRFETTFAGLHSNTPVTESQLAQADVIIVMEEWHRQEIARLFPGIYLQKQTAVFGIPDIYRDRQPDLLSPAKAKPLFSYQRQFRM
jgi:predicted protein tyrosine phosphatase